MTVLSALPVRIDLVCPDGGDVSVKFALTQGVGGAPVNLTGETVKFTARQIPQGTVTIPTKLNTSHTNAAGGETTFLLTRTELDLVDENEPETWVYEVRRITGGLEILYFTGALRVIPMVGAQ